MKRLHAFVTVAALLFMGANLAQAQKSKGVGMSAVGKAHSKAHMSKADKDAAKDTHDAAKAQRKADERAEKNARDQLKDQPRELLKGVRLSKEEKSAVKTIERKTDEAIEVLEKQEKVDEKAGTPMADAAQKLNALRDQERTEIRAALTPEHQARLDRNVTTMHDKH